MLGAMTSGENKTTSNDEMLRRAIGMDSAAENDLSIYMIASSDDLQGNSSTKARKEATSNLHRASRT